MTKVVDLKAPFFGEVPVDKVLRGADAAGLDSAIVIGYRGEELYLAFTMPDGAHVLWALEEAKKALME